MQNFRKYYLIKNYIIPRYLKANKFLLKSFTCMQKICYNLCNNGKKGGFMLGITINGELVFGEKSLVNFRIYDEKLQTTK